MESSVGLKPYITLLLAKDTKGRSSGQTPFTIKPKPLAHNSQPAIFFITGLAAEKAHFRQK
jgi:hypothetical protein